MILRGGTVVDGTGAPAVVGDLLVERGRIAAVGSAARWSDPQVIDLTGLVVTPGFVDMHAHSDLAVLADPDHLAKVGQGVTLEVVGQDGLGYAPVTDASMALVRSQIAGWNGDPPLDYAWRSVADYLARVERGAALNVATLVPHGTVRMAVLGMASRAADPDELAAMRTIVARGLEDGAVGLSTGLTYAPGMFASDDELADALVAVREHGGYYCPHHRNYGSRVVEGYRDCLALAERAGVPLHLAHCHVNYPVNRGRAPEVLGAIDAALDRGVDVSLDAYPYLSSATTLVSLLPHRAHDGGAERTIALLEDPVQSAALRREVEVEGSDGNHGVPVDWSAVTVSSTVSPHAGQRIDAAARREGVPAWDLVVRMLLQDRLTTGCVLAVGNEENMLAVMRHPAHTVGTDGILVGQRPHPRGWGSFPTFLGRFARDAGLFPLEEAVAHLTSRPARRLGLTDRGRIAEGVWADLVVLDPDRIGSRATYDDPRRAPDGIRLVLVNGVVVVEDGVRTAALPGRAVRGPGHRPGAPAARRR